MALKQLDPLNEKQWKFVMSSLNSEPTEKQKSMARESVEQGKKIKTIQ